MIERHFIVIEIKNVSFITFSSIYEMYFRSKSQNLKNKLNPPTENNGRLLNTIIRSLQPAKDKWMQTSISCTY